MSKLMLMHYCRSILICFVDTMSSGLSNLKLLAKGLNTEIEAQNDQVDRIMPKVDRADTKIRDQNRQMKNILGK